MWGENLFISSAWRNTYYKDYYQELHDHYDVDGSDLSGTYTFTNGSAIVQGNSSADTTEIKVGDIVIDDNGDKVRVADIQPKRTVATSAVYASNEQITITNHGFVANQEVFYEANGGTAIAGLTDETIFFVKTV